MQPLVVSSSLPSFDSLTKKAMAGSPSAVDSILFEKAVMPTNAYGPGDNYDLNNAHVVPALIRKIHEAKKVNKSSFEAWGSGQVWREFLYSDDLAESCVYLLNLPPE